MRRILLLTLIVAGCVATPRPPPASGAAAFPVLAFFNGHTRGEGSLKIMAGKRQSVHVDGHGHIDTDGSLVLEQSVDRAGKPATNRTWVIRETSPGHYTGTLSDARGPVTGETDGDRLHLSFRTKSGFAAQQWITLAADGRSAHNIMVVRKMGVTLAVLDETIRRIDPGQP